MFNGRTICQNGASQTTNMPKYFYLNLLIKVVQKLMSLILFSRLLFQLSGDVNQQMYCFFGFFCA